MHAILIAFIDNYFDDNYLKHYSNGGDKFVLFITAEYIHPLRLKDKIAADTPILSFIGSFN